MKTLRLRGGDLVLGQGGFETLTGVDRIVQDLRVALAEPLGVDRFHPGWGSTVDDFVGQTLNHSTAFDLRQEVNRVVGNYMAVQSEKAARDSLRSTTTRYTSSDLISHVTDVDVKYRQDKAEITLTVATVSGETFTTNFEVEANG